MVTKDEIYHTLSYKDWKCVHEVKEELTTATTSSLETHLFQEFVQSREEVLIPAIERYLTSFVDQKVAEYRTRTQTNEQVKQCGLQRKELEYRLVPQEIKKCSGTEAGKSGEYAAKVA